MSQRDPATLVRHYADSSDPDQRTSMSDARIALCLARGVAMDDIDPASGRDYSRATYDRCRRDWICQVKMHGFSDFYGDGARLADLIAYWAKVRPDFTAGDDWLADAEKAHRTCWEQDGRACSNPRCDFHPSDDHAELLRIIAEQSPTNPA